MPENPFPPPPGHARRQWDTYHLASQMAHLKSVGAKLDDRIQHINPTNPRCIFNMVAPPGMGKTLALRQWVHRGSSTPNTVLVYVSLAPLIWIDPGIDSKGGKARIGEFFRVIAKNLSKVKISGLKIPEVTMDIEDICQKFYTSLGLALGGRHLCIVLDEFHRIRPSLMNPDLQKAIFWPLFETYPRFQMSYIIADRSPLDVALAPTKINAMLNEVEDELFLGHPEIKSYLSQDGDLTWFGGHTAFAEIYKQTNGHPALVSWIGFLAYERYHEEGRYHFSEGEDKIRKDIYPYLTWLWKQYKETLNLNSDHLKVLTRLTIDPDGASWQVKNFEDLMSQLKEKRLIIYDSYSGKWRLKIPLFGDVLKRVGV